MISYFALDALTKLHIEHLQHQSDMARLAAQAGRAARPGYRQRIALGLRAFARRIDPSCEPSVGHRTLVALPR